MKLSRLLYIIITIIFFMIFIGNFYISLQNTKSYIKSESESKTQDAATSLGLRISSLISNKKDPEIQVVINAIADSGFYKEIKLEDAFYTFNDKYLIQSNDKLNGLAWNISDVSINDDYGKIIISNEDILSNELDILEDTSVKNNSSDTIITDNTYTFIPSKNFKNKNIEVSYVASMNNQLLQTKSTINLNKIIAINSRDVKFDNVPQWFINLINIDIETKSVDISDGWKKTAILYVSSNPGIAYEKLYIH